MKVSRLGDDLRLGRFARFQGLTGGVRRQMSAQLKGIDAKCFETSVRQQVLAAFVRTVDVGER